MGNERGVSYPTLGFNASLFSIKFHSFPYEDKFSTKTFFMPISEHILMSNFCDVIPCFFVFFCYQPRDLYYIWLLYRMFHIYC